MAKVLPFNHLASSHATIKRRYKAHPTLQRYHHSRAFHRGIRGPRGSGKSTGSCCDLFAWARSQDASSDGIRYTRFAVVRNTYRELMDTTLKTWLYWFPEDYLGKFNYNHMTHFIKWQDINCEMLFRALDRPGDVKKTLSMELTGAYINEAKEVPFGIISGLDDAIGRYPPKDLDNNFHGPTFKGMILDTNSPDDDHWWYKLEQQFMAGDLDPKIWEFFVQPGGLVERDGDFVPNPDAENLDYIGPDYYTTRMVGKSKDHIRVYYCNQFGFVLEGKSVHPEYVDAVHCSQSALAPVPGVTIIVGIDFGLTPAATFGQRLVNGRWQVINELVTERMGISSFAEELKQFCAHHYKGYQFEFYGDPAGTQESQTDERTPFAILQAAGIPAVPAYSNNDPVIRRESLQAPLSRLIDGKPGMMLSPVCHVLRKALAGGYCYRRKQIAGTEQYHDKPDKNKYCHVAEACEYMTLGSGEGKNLVINKNRDPVDDSDFIEMDMTIDRGSGREFGGSGGLGWMG